MAKGKIMVVTVVVTVAVAIAAVEGVAATIVPIVDLLATTAPPLPPTAVGTTSATRVEEETTVAVGTVAAVTGPVATNSGTTVT